MSNKRFAFVLLASFLGTVVISGLWLAVLSSMVPDQVIQRVNYNDNGLPCQKIYVATEDHPKFVLAGTTCYPEGGRPKVTDPIQVRMNE